VISSECGNKTVEFQKLKRRSTSMTPEHTDIALALCSALAAGSLIGLERSYHGRPAGFRTHALVSLSSALLMLVAVYQWRWFGGTPLEAVRIDPTRMAQGIMTGIGFLGAGVIFKEGLTVRGLTTAASIWITAALGILFGVGFYFPAILGTIATLGILSCFRWIEAVIPGQSFSLFTVRFDRARIMSEADLRALLRGHGFSTPSLSYELCAEGRQFEYQTVIRTTRETDTAALTAELLAHDDVLEFSIQPNGD
jgi:putative Mg2+ transporter-C (MgtC) family protein